MDQIVEKRTTQNEIFSIVFLGDFSPLNFTPKWFFDQKCIAQEDYDQTCSPENKNTFLTPGLVTFETSFFSIEVTQQRFSVLLKKNPYTLLSDFVNIAFQNLTGIKIRALGINYQCVYAIANASLYQQIGDRLAPKSYWAKLLGDEVSGDYRKSSLNNISMRKLKNGDDKGAINITLSPSPLVKQFGIVISNNDHCDFGEDVTMGDVLAFLKDKFETSILDSIALQADLLKGLLDE